jgi:hypothetical protein
MLTATYSLVTISTEQNKTRSVLRKLQQYIQNTWKGLQNIDLDCLDSVFKSLTQFDKYFRTRKVEVYLVPAIRRATSEADSLLAELDALSVSSMNLLRSVREQLGRAFEGGGLRFNEACSSIDLYCNNMLTRLIREEEELFPLARRVFSVDEWFSLAEKFLADEAEGHGRKRYLRQPPLMPAPNPASLLAAL